jgi:hypothetical protein
VWSAGYIMCWEWWKSIPSSNILLADTTEHLPIIIEK